MKLARAGLVRGVSPGRKLTWGKVADAYRELLYVKACAVSGGVTSDGRVASRGGFDQRNGAALAVAGGKLRLSGEGKPTATSLSIAISKIYCPVLDLF